MNEYEVMMQSMEPMVSESTATPLELTHAEYITINQPEDVTNTLTIADVKGANKIYTPNYDPNTVSISDPERKKKLVRERVYFYAFNAEGKIVCNYYIPFQSFRATKIRQVVTDILVDHPDTVEIYMADNSRDLHEGFRRCLSSFRPTEDRATFRVFLMETGVQVYSALCSAAN